MGNDGAIGHNRSPMDDAERRRRAELTAYLASSRRVRRRLPWVFAIGVAITVGLWLAGLGAPAVPLAAVCTAIVVGAGWWITFGHIADFQGQLDELDAIKRRALAASAPGQPSRPRREPSRT